MSEAPFILINLSVSFYCWKINSILSFFSFMSLSKYIVFRRGFSLALSTCSLNVGETWFIMG